METSGNLTDHSELLRYNPNRLTPLKCVQEIGGHEYHFNIGYPTIPFDLLLEFDDQDDPYVFHLPDLKIDGGSKVACYRDVVVMGAHGGRCIFGQDDDVLRIGRRLEPAAKLVEAYNIFARSKKLPALDFLLACNTEANSEAIQHGIIVADVPVEEKVAHIVNSHLSGRFLKGKDEILRLRVNYNPKKGDFWGLENLERKKVDSF